MRLRNITRFDISDDIGMTDITKYVSDNNKYKTYFKKLIVKWRASSKLCLLKEHLADRFVLSSIGLLSANKIDKDAFYGVGFTNYYINYSRHKKFCNGTLSFSSFNEFGKYESKSQTMMHLTLVSGRKARK